MPRTGAGREERHPLGVIPVQVSKQQRSSERGRAEHGVQVNQADLFADAAHHALVKDARAARKASAASQAPPVRTRLRLILRFAVA